MSPFYIVLNTDAFTLRKIGENTGMGAYASPKYSVKLSISRKGALFPAGIFKF